MAEHSPLGDKSSKYDELVLCLKIAEQLAFDPRHKSTMLQAHEAIRQLERELAAANARALHWERQALDIAKELQTASSTERTPAWIEQELKDGDRICEAAGVQRTEGGRLPVAKIINALAKKLWLWKNFVDGRPEYWAFDNPYPCFPNGDPVTLGEPCGYAIVKQSIRGRDDVSDEKVIEAIKRARPVASSTAFVTPERNTPEYQDLLWHVAGCPMGLWDGGEIDNMVQRVLNGLRFYESERRQTRPEERRGS